MDAVLALGSPSLPLSARPPLPRRDRIRQTPRFPLRCSPVGSKIDAPKPEYKPGPLDDLLLAFFRKKMVEEVRWDSEKPGYTGLIEVANHLMMKGKTISETEQSAILIPDNVGCGRFNIANVILQRKNAFCMTRTPVTVTKTLLLPGVRVLQSLFPPLLLVLYKMLISPINDGKVASMMLARATAMLCQWLMGPCSINSVDLADGSSCTSGVFVERCKYLEESKCLGVCVNTCKLPTQRFFKEYMGVPLYMEPNFSDYSCQFNFGVLPPPPASDKALQEPCLAICPNATRRRELGTRNIDQCPKV